MPNWTTQIKLTTTNPESTMDMESNKVFLALSAVFVLLLVISKLRSRSKSPKLNLPPTPWTLPVIGSLHHLATSSRPHHAMRLLANKYGPIMMLKLGEIPALVLSSPAAAQEVLKTHDLKFADRNINPTLYTFSYDCTDLTFAPYGERWRHLRKIAVMELLNPGPARMLAYRRIREDEVAGFVTRLAGFAADGAPVNLSKMISNLINDYFVRQSVGSRCKYQDEYLDAFQTSLRQTSSLTIADLFPSSRLLRFFSTAPKKVLESRVRMHRVLRQIIREKTAAMDRGEDDQEDCFLGVMIRLQKEGSTPIPLTEDTMVALMFNMFAAGSETSSIVLTWCMTELIRSPAVMTKAQAELREALKGKNKITEQDVEGLPYLRMMTKEALRLHPPGPFLIPRMCRETCQIMGYDIPKGSVVFLNAWAIARDPKYWDGGDPEEFRPERFENSNLDYRGANYEYLPFGSGRRICPGINLGVDNFVFALASMLYHFDWKLPDGMEPKDLDMDEASGMAASKKTPLVLHPITRIPPAY